MLKKLKSEDFYYIKDVALRNMTPSKINMFLIASTIYSFLTIAVSTYAVILKELVYAPAFYKLNMAFLIAFIVQLILVILFLNNNILFKYQKLQAWMLPIVGFKMSIDLYVLYFFLCIDHNAPEIMSTIALIMLIFGLVLLIISIIRIIQSAKAGNFRRGGKGLLKNQNNSGSINLWVIVGGVSVVAILRRLLKNVELFGVSFDLVFVLILCVFIQYMFIFVCPRLFLIAYCKQRFS